MPPTHVLLVEDSRAMRDFVSSILEAEAGYEVHAVANGFEALRELPRREHGLIVTDINIPDVSGIELTHFVRSSPKHADTPIIAISTDSSEKDIARALGAGATRFLAKPFTRDELRDLIAGLNAEATG